MKKILIIMIILFCILELSIFWWSKNLKPQNISPIANATSVPSESPTPQPTPLVNIDENSDLNLQINKLKVLEFDEDYQNLNQTLSNF